MCFGKWGKVAVQGATSRKISVTEGRARGAVIKVDGLQYGRPAPPTGRNGLILKLLQRRVSGWYAPLKLPAVISVAVTPMALPAAVPSFE